MAKTLSDFNADEQESILDLAQDLIDDNGSLEEALNNVQNFMEEHDVSEEDAKKILRSCDKNGMWPE